MNMVRWLALIGLLALPQVARAQTNTFLVVSCGDCGTWGGMVLYVDGAQTQQGAYQSVRAEVMPGRHQVKADVWKGPFKHEVWWEGVLDIPANTEARYNVVKGAMNLVGKTALEPPARPVDRGAISDALDYVKDALDKSDDEPSRCAGKVGNRLDELADIIKDAMDDQDPSANVRRALRKAREAAAFSDDQCPPRVARAIGRPLRKAIACLGSGCER
jgi:hypothetical protein